MWSRQGGALYLPVCMSASLFALFLSACLSLSLCSLPLCLSLSLFALFLSVCLSLSLCSLPLCLSVCLSLSLARRAVTCSLPTVQLTAQASSHAWPARDCFEDHFETCPGPHLDAIERCGQGHGVRATRIARARGRDRGRCVVRTMIMDIAAERGRVGG